MRVVFAGTPLPALPALRALLDSHHEVLAVLTKPDAPRGRGRQLAPAPVAELAAERGLETLRPVKPSEPAFLDRLAELAPDCCPVVAYGALVPGRGLAIPRHGWINLHFSLLPAWRGAAPVQHALLRGDEVTGASVFQLEAGLDTGPVFGVTTEPVRARDTAGDLLDRLAESGAGLLVAALDGIEAGTLQPTPQPADGVTMAPKITVEDARIDWAAPAFAVDRRVRACTPDPGGWTTFRDARLGLGPVTPVDDGPSLGLGEPVVERRRVLVGTGTGSVELSDVRSAGRRPMPAVDWARGARPGPGERLV